jgi:O-methyltransferase
LQLRRLSADVPEDAVMAELGVYRGQTARLLQLMAPQRQLILFDTFKGFREEDLENESGKALSYTSANFDDTSMALVQEKLAPLDKIRFFKGDFSAVIPEIPEVQYAFVSIDADLAAPTLAGLRYFYPRLCPGGVIIVHDYNENWPSLMEAVDAFLATIPEQPALIPDQDSSLMIVKNALV